MVASDLINAAAKWKSPPVSITVVSEQIWTGSKEEAHCRLPYPNIPQWWVQLTDESNVNPSLGQYALPRVYLKSVSGGHHKIIKLTARPGTWIACQRMLQQQPAIETLQLSAP